MWIYVDYLSDQNILVYSIYGNIWILYGNI